MCISIPGIGVKLSKCASCDIVVYLVIEMLHSDAQVVGNACDNLYIRPPLLPGLGSCDAAK